MNLLKEWYGKKGLLARWYSCNGIYFLDYNMCHETSQLAITVNGVNVVVTAQMPDVPKKYLSEISTLYKKGVR